MPVVRTWSEFADRVDYVVDDAGCGRKLGADRFAHVDPERSVLVVWFVQCIPDERVLAVVSVHSYLPNTQLTTDEAHELASDYNGRNWSYRW